MALRTRAGILPWTSPPQYKPGEHWLQDSGALAVSGAWGWPRHVDHSLGWAEQAGGSPRSPCELKKRTFYAFQKETHSARLRKQREELCVTLVQTSQTNSKSAGNKAEFFAQGNIHTPHSTLPQEPKCLGKLLQGGYRPKSINRLSAGTHLGLPLKVKSLRMTLRTMSCRNASLPSWGDLSRHLPVLENPKIT